MTARRTSARHAIRRPPESMAHRDLTRGEVRDGRRDKIWADAARATFKVDAMVLLEGFNAAKTDADIGADPIELFFRRGLESRAFNGLVGRLHREMDKARAFADALFFDDGFGVKALHLASDL